MYMVNILLLIAGTVVVATISYANGQLSKEEDMRLLKRDCNSYREALREKSRDASYYQTKYYELISEYNQLVNAYNRIKNNKPQPKQNVDMRSALVQKAIKKAMMDAHPDRSGTNATANEFIEYKKLYDEIRK